MELSLVDCLYKVKALLHSTFFSCNLCHETKHEDEAGDDDMTYARSVIRGTFV